MQDPTTWDNCLPSLDAALKSSAAQRALLRNLCAAAKTKSLHELASSLDRMHNRVAADLDSEIVKAIDKDSLIVGWALQARILSSILRFIQCFHKSQTSHHKLINT